MERQRIELLTIKEAALLLRVSTVTISRWIKQGRLAANYVGPRSIRIRRDDLDSLLTSARGRAAAHMPDQDLMPMTDEEVGRFQAAIERAELVRSKMLMLRNGKPFASSAELIAREREARSQEQ